MEDTLKEKLIIEKDGKPTECDVLFTFDCEDTMKSYVGYTDHSIGKNGRKNIYVSGYNPFDKSQELENITDPRELEMIADVLETIDEESKKM
ncbi:MAG: DUF1292 domain-containing protein [Bacilli bacterium]|nr:DUF1292 domain-containing protein [Bacilli bacterium]